MASFKEIYGDKPMDSASWADSVDAELPPGTATSMALVLKREQVSTDLAKNLLATFGPLAIQADDLIREAMAINVTDPNDKAGIAAAHEKRMAMKPVRIEAEKKRREAKDGFLRGGRAVDGIGNSIVKPLELAETRLEEMEKIAQRAEEARLRQLSEARVAELAALGWSDAFTNLAAMAEPAYQAMKAAIIAQAEQRRRDEEAAENERSRQREANELIRQENLKLAEEKRKADAALAEQQRKAAEERRKAQVRADLAAKQAREAQEAIDAKARALQAELDRKNAAEAKAKADAEAEKRRAATAPDREKLLAWASAIESILSPHLASSEFDQRVKDFQARIADAVARFRSAISVDDTPPLSPAPSKSVAVWRHR